MDHEDPRRGGAVSEGGGRKAEEGGFRIKSPGVWAYGFGGLGFRVSESSTVHNEFRVEGFGS